MISRLILAAGLISGGAITATAAYAQATDEELGYTIGGFRAYPTLVLGVAQDDNIYADETNERDDTLGIVTPSLRLASLWSRHALKAEIGADHREYFDTSDDSTTDYWGDVDGRLDIQRDFRVTAGANYKNAHEGRGSTDISTVPGVVFLREPVEFEETRGRVGIEKEFNRIRVSGGYALSTIDYEDGLLSDGTFLDQDFRDRDLTEATARLDYAITPDTSVFVAYGHRAYDYDSIVFGNRDFTAQDIFAGARFDITHLLTGEIAVGAFKGKSDDQTAFDDTDGFAARGSVDWQVTQLTKVHVALGRNVGESYAANIAANSTTREEASLRVDHELRRNIDLYGHVAFYKDEFEGIDRDDEETKYGVGAQWHMNRTAALGVDFVRQEHQSTGVARDRDFDRNYAALTLTLRR